MKYKSRRRAFSKSPHPSLHKASPKTTGILRAASRPILCNAGWYHSSAPAGVYEQTDTDTTEDYIWCEGAEQEIGVAFIPQGSG